LLAVIYNLKGEVYLAQQKIDVAEICFQDAIKQNPDFLRPYYALARIYLKGHQEDKAIAQYQSLLVKDPNQVVPHMLLGTIFDMQKRFDLSEAQYRAALEIDPNFVPAANNLSYLLANQDKDLDKALALAQTAKEKLPDDFTRKVMAGLPKVATAQVEAPKKFDLRLIALIAAVSVAALFIIFNFDFSGIFKAAAETSENNPIKYLNLLTSVSKSFSDGFSSLKITSISIVALSSLVALYFADSFFKRFFNGNAETA